MLDVDSKDTSILRCGRKQLNNLLESHYDRLTQTINIAIGHHPIGDFSKEEQKHILSLFHRYNIGLYFCGHKHSNLKTESIDWDKQYVQIKGIAEKTRNLIDQGNTVPLRLRHFLHHL